MKIFKIYTNSEEFGESVYKVAANSKEEAQRLLIAEKPRIAEEDSDPYELPPNKKEIIEIIEEEGEIKLPSEPGVI
jgi:hypothetical protein